MAASADHLSPPGMAVPHLCTAPLPVLMGMDTIVMAPMPAMHRRELCYSSEIALDIYMHNIICCFWIYAIFILQSSQLKKKSYGFLLLIANSAILSQYPLGSSKFS